MRSRAGSTVLVGILALLLGGCRGGRATKPESASPRVCTNESDRWSQWMYLSSDESYVAFGTMLQGSSYIGCIQILRAGDTEPLDVDPAAVLLAVPSLEWPRNSYAVAGADRLLYRTSIKPWDPTTGIIYPTGLSILDVKRGVSTALDIVAAMGPLGLVPGSDDVLFVDEDGLYRASSDGGDPELLLPAGGNLRYVDFAHLASFSPSGRMMAALSPGAVYVVDLAGGGARRVDEVVDSPSIPAFTPDGSTVVFSFRDPDSGVSKIAAVDVATLHLREVQVDPRSIISSDGSLALASDQQHDPASWQILDLESGNARTFTGVATPGGFTAGNRWVWVTVPSGQSSAIRLVRTDGSQDLTIPHLACDRPVSVFEDDRFAVFEQCDDGNYHLVAYRLSDGSEQDFGSGYLLAVGPRSIVFDQQGTGSGSNQLWTWDEDTGELRDRGPFSSARATPDGQHVLVVDQGELRSLESFGTGDIVLDEVSPYFGLQGTSVVVGNRRIAYRTAQGVKLKDLDR